MKPNLLFIFAIFHFIYMGQYIERGGGGLELRSPEVQSIYAGDTIRLF